MNYQKTNVCGIISLILGIQAIILCCIKEVSIVIAIIAIILGIIGLIIRGYQKGQAIAGLCCAITAITLIIVLEYINMSMTGELDDFIYYMKSLW